MIILLISVVVAVLSCTETVHDITLRDINGKAVPLSLYRGKPLVVYVWSGTCVGHTEDLKRLATAFPHLRGRLNLITVALMMNEDEARKVLRESGVEPPYPVLVDPEGDLARKVTLLFLPATIVFNGKGIPVENLPGLPDDLISLVSSHE
ncbi:MAG: TlpA disulfide reductase family protein [Aquificota bacterium]|nr:TlpA disulfide reductase family protein [Aquificota bacterium]